MSMMVSVFAHFRFVEIESLMLGGAFFIVAFFWVLSVGVSISVGVRANSDEFTLNSTHKTVQRKRVVGVGPRLCAVRTILAYYYFNSSFIVCNNKKK